MNNKINILIAEDEKTLNKLITKRLENIGYEVTSCSDGESALEQLKTKEFHLAILDIMMPKLYGTEVLAEIRKCNIDIPVLFLTAKDSVEDRVNGLDLGANDYIVKPFHFDELAARIRAVLRNNKSTSMKLTVADLVLDRTSRTVTRAGQEIILSSREFDVLEYLMKHKGEVLTRERIESDVWKVDYCGLTNVIDVYIRYLRKKIDDDHNQKLIHTIRGAGYVLKE